MWLIPTIEKFPRTQTFLLLGDRWRASRISDAYSASGMTCAGCNLFDPLKRDPPMLLDRKRVIGRLQDDTRALIV